VTLQHSQRIHRCWFADGRQYYPPSAVWWSIHGPRSQRRCDHRRAVPVLFPLPRRRWIGDPIATSRMTEEQSKPIFIRRMSNLPYSGHLTAGHCPVHLQRTISPLIRMVFRIVQTRMFALCSCPYDSTGTVECHMERDGVLGEGSKGTVE
jgi:hypothetical protein